MFKIYQQYEGVFKFVKFLNILYYFEKTKKKNVYTWQAILSADNRELLKEQSFSNSTNTKDAMKGS